MPQNITRSQEQTLPGNIVKPYVGDDAEYIADQITATGEAAGKALDQYTVTTANDALAYGEAERAALAQSGTEVYKTLLTTAAAEQNKEVFGKLYAEAQRVKTATEQGIMSDSTAQLRLTKLEKDLAFRHPQLASQLRAAASAVSGNASQILQMSRQDPYIKSLEDVYAKAQDMGMSPAEYMSHRRQSAITDLKLKELNYANEMKAYKTEDYIASYGSYIAGDTAEKVNGFVRDLNKSLQAAGGMLPGEDAAMAVIKFRDDLRRYRISEIDELVRKDPEGIDRKKMIEAIDDDLTYLTEMAAIYKSGTSLTAEHTEAMIRLQEFRYDAARKKGFQGMFSGFPPLLQYIFEKDPAKAMDMVEGAYKAANAALLNNKIPGSREFLAGDAEGAFKYSLIQEALGSEDGAQMFNRLFGSATYTLFSQGPVPPALTGNAKKDAENADFTLSNFSAVADDPAQARMALSNMLAPQASNFTIAKLATFPNRDTVSAMVSDDPGLKKLLMDKATMEMFVILEPMMGRFTVGMSDNPQYPIQMASGTAPYRQDNTALADANALARYYMSLSPDTYVDFVKLLRERAMMPMGKASGPE